MKRVHVFTSAAFNYIPKVRMLFQSLRRLHPEFVLHLALADKLHPDIDLSNEPFDEIIPLESMNIPGTTGWSFCHRIVELATAIKPFALQQLLAREDCDKVLYMDPDTVAFSRLDDILEALDHNSMVLTPHLTTPEDTVEGVMDNEISCLKHGIYNLGFVGVRADEEGRRFGRWWGDRIYRFCRDDIKHGLFTDQRWIDLVPAFFNDVGILKSPRLNVATWNLRTRRFAGSMMDGFTVNGYPLGFYHFTGFDSGAHRAMAERNAGGNDAVQELINWYTAQTDVLAHDPLAKVEWAYAKYSDGTPITAAQRIVYRDRMDLQAVYPDPYDVRGYLKWWSYQAASEYPGLFNPSQADLALQRLSKVLTPGYSAIPIHMEAAKLEEERLTVTGSGIANVVLGSGEMFNRSAPTPLLSRAWGVFRREGVLGVLRRLK